MKKKILILKSVLPKKGPEKILIEYLKKNLGRKIDVRLKRLADALIQIETGKVEVYFGEKKASDFDLIWIRQTGKQMGILAAALGACFDHLKIEYFDTCFGKRSAEGSKLAILIRLALGGLPVPLSIFCWKSSIKERKAQIIKTIGFPMVAKILDIHWGKGVFVLDNSEDFEKVIDKAEKESQILFQKFHPHRGDYRILVLGYEVGAWEIMYRVPDLSTAKMGRLEPIGELKKKEFFPVEKIPPLMKELAIKAAKITEMEVAGVDIFEDKNTGEYFFTEVNRAPAFATDYPGDPELKAVATFLEKTLK